MTEAINVAEPVRATKKSGFDITWAQLCVALLFGIIGSVFVARHLSAAPGPIVTPIMSKELANIPGKEALMLTVVYPPGGVDPVHRHNANAFVYVLEGSIVMGLKGGQEVTLKAGQTFYEGPDDLHLVGRNASSTKPARFLAVLIKDKGVPAVLPIEDLPGSRHHPG
jgi:quercetin dioxygenase-like cupin family protein